MLVGGAPVLLLAIIFEDLSAIRVTPAAVGSLVYLAAIGSVGAFLMYYWLLRRTTAIAVSMIAFITPLVAIVLGRTFMEETLSLRVSLGTSLILSGVAFVLRRPNRKEIDLSYDHG
jgi:drug/metabolite transporter (DMT)-like permease